MTKRLAALPVLSLLSIALSACQNVSDVADTTDAPIILSASPSWIADDDAPTIKGAAPAYSTVTLYGSADCSGDAIGTGIANLASAFSIVVAVESDAVTPVSAIATMNGVDSECVVSATPYTEDSTDPAAPVLMSLVPAGPSRNPSPVLTGTTEPHAYVQVYTDTTCTGEAAGFGQADANGTFSFSLSATANLTLHTSVKVQDAAAHSSPCIVGYSYTHDETAP